MKLQTKNAVAALVAAVALAAAVAAAVVALVAVAEADEYKDYVSSIKMSVFSILLSIISLILSQSISLDFTPLINWYVLGLVIILAEIYFFLDSKKPTKKDNKLLFTAKRKAISWFYSIISILGIYFIYEELKNYWQEILKWIGYIGVGTIGLAIIIGIVCLYIKLNSLKYRK